jgi:ATP-dependent helicase/nuclease subunit A
MSDLHPTGPLEHLAILASAGTGKTHALAHRYIGLLGRGVEADRICALTFSRKAATEIFDTIVAYLVKAAQSPAAAKETGRHSELAGLTPVEASRLLRNLVSRLHRVQIGTLDSFIVSVLRAFSAELGVPSDFALLGSGSVEARQLTQDALGFLLNPAHSHADLRDAFFDAFKKATFGREEKGFSETFFDTLEVSLGLFRQYPNPDIWGNPAVIWRRPDWIGTPNASMEKALDRVREFAAGSGAVGEALVDGLEEAATFLPFNVWKTQVFESTLMKRLFEQMPTLEAGGNLVFQRKTIPIDPETGQAIRQILLHLMRQEILRALIQTQGLGSMLGKFNDLYDAAIRKRGAFTFNDAQYLLTPRNRNGAGAISRQAGEANRLYIDYRLDARLDHWLLDEFQDTSDLQWETLDNLASEIIQDTSGERSFFLVGDVKQAIHGWRGGNAELFGQLLEKYGKGIGKKTLSASFRSTPPVLNMVNRLFSDIAGLDLPEAAVTRWTELWETHVSQVDKPGCAAWLEPQPNDEGEVDEESVYRAAAGVIRDLAPVARGLSIALLLPTNKACTEAADALRHELGPDHIPVVNEGAAELAGNPVVALMLSLLRFAAHPGDTMSHMHMLMSPLRAAVEAAGDRLPLLLQTQIQTEGFVAFFRSWAARLESVTGPLDTFGTKRFHDLLAVAAEADAAGSRDPDALVAQVDAHELREQTAGGAVRIMTIHQAKGLGFDAVLVPLLGNGGLATVGQLDLSAGETDGKPWVLKMPRQIVSKADPVLRQRHEEATADTAFSSLCVLYVAMTRARQGLYVLTRYGRKKRPSGRSLSEGIFVSRRLLDTDQPESVEGRPIMAGGVPLRELVLEGDWHWSRSIVPVKPARAPAQVPATLFPAKEAATVRLKRVEPSRGDSEERQADWLFKPESRGVLDFGTIIHELLARVDWSDTSDADAILAGWKPAKAYARDVLTDAAAQFQALMRSPDVRQGLARPDARTELWREKSFELVDGDAWISGAFDRVMVCRDEKGKAVSAVLMDYKSKRINSESDMPAAAEVYRHQLTLYRRALTKLLKLDEHAIEIRILFTRMARFYRADY